MVGQHHSFNKHELGQTPGDGEGQGGLVCCSPWGHKELDMTEQLSTEHIYVYVCEYMCVCVFIAQILASQKS